MRGAIAIAIDDDSYRWRRARLRHATSACCVCFVMLRLDRAELCSAVCVLCMEIDKFEFQISAEDVPAIIDRACSATFAGVAKIPFVCLCHTHTRPSSVQEKCIIYNAHPFLFLFSVIKSIETWDISGATTANSRHEHIGHRNCV